MEHACSRLAGAWRGTEPVALVHDYLTQRGGAERVALAMARAFPDAPLYTSLYDPAATFPEFAEIDVRPSPARPCSRAAPTPPSSPPTAGAGILVDVDRRRCLDLQLERLGAWRFDDWSQGRVLPRAARWLYQTDRYLGTDSPGHNSDRSLKRTVLESLRKRLVAWDRAAAASADRYLVNSRASGEAVLRIYGRKAEVLAPPTAIGPGGALRQVRGIEPGYWLCVCRLLPYKNIDLVIEAVRAIPQARLVVVGDGPERSRLESMGGAPVTFLRGLGDDELRWCYANCKALLTASYEDFGLTPLEVASFGKPTAAPRFGGFLDTIVEGRTGVFFERPDSRLIMDAMHQLDAVHWDSEALKQHADGFGEERFGERLREVVAEESAKLS